MPVDYSAPMPPLSQGSPFRDFILEMSERFYVDSWRDCATHLGLQTGIDIEYLHLRGGSHGHGKTVVTFLSNYQTDLVNKCVANWNDAIKSGSNPGIPHDQISVPVAIASPVLRDLNAKAGYFDSQIHEELGVEDYIVQRIVREDRGSMEGAIFFHAVKMLMAATQRSRKDIIREPTLEALATEPRPIFVYEADQELEDREIPEPPIIYSYEQVFKAAQYPSIVTPSWRAYRLADTRAEQLELVIAIAEALKADTVIREEDIDASLTDFYARGLRLAEPAPKPVRSRKKATNGAMTTYLPVLWSQEEQIRVLVSGLIMHTNGTGQTRTDDTTSQQKSPITQTTSA